MATDGLSPRTQRAIDALGDPAQAFFATEHPDTEPCDMHARDDGLWRLNCPKCRGEL